MKKNNHRMSITQLNGKEKKDVISTEDRENQQVSNVINQNSMNHIKREEKSKKWNESKTKSDNSIKYCCYYLYWLLLNLKETTEIVLNRHKRKKAQNDRIDNFTCSMIKVDGKIIFQAKTEYVISESPNHHYPTVMIDDDTQIPMMVKMMERKQSADESCKIQQHILIQIINNMLKPFSLEIPHVTMLG